MKQPIPELSDDDRARYEWQMWVPGLGESGQQRLKASTVLVSRVGGVGGAAACYLAAAGVGRLVLAHAGNLKSSDLNRQTLMATDWIGKPRITSAARRLKEINPSVEIAAIPQNASAANAGHLVAQADVVIDAAPLFEERFALNREAVRQGKPMVECAMHEMEAHLTVVLPGRSPCLACLYPENPTHWRRQFPVIGAVPGAVGALAAAEAIKLITGLGEPLAGRLLVMDIRAMRFRQMRIRRDPACPVCAYLPENPSA